MAAALAALALAAVAFALWRPASEPPSAEQGDPPSFEAAPDSPGADEAPSADAAPSADEGGGRSGGQGEGGPLEQDPGEGEAPPGLEPQGPDLAARMDAYLDQNFARTQVPGAAVAVVDAEGVRYLRVLGDCPSAQAPFAIGSLSKSFTALAVMQLVEEGRIDLDAPASLYAPSYGTPADVTVRSLLNQTSGFGYFESLADARRGESFGSFSYSNANYDLLGRIVEGVSGQDFSSYLSDKVFAPLGMDHASAGFAALSAPGMAPGHRDWFGLPVADGFVHGFGDDAWGGPSSGYVTASVQDMARYLQMYLRGGRGPRGQEVISAAGEHSMFMDRVPDPGGDTYYGMGWTSYSSGDGELVLSHDGLVENYVASMCLLPERGVGVVVLGDAAFNSGGSSLFFQMASGVSDVAIGAAGEPVDPAGAAVWRCRVDVLYAAALLGALAPLLLVRHWRRGWAAARSSASDGGPGRGLASRRAQVLRAIALHAMLPIAVLALPWLWSESWRDLIGFAPDAAAVLVGVGAILLIGGAAKLAVALGGASRRGSEASVGMDAQRR